MTDTLKCRERLRRCCSLSEHLQKIGLNVPQVTLLTDKLRLAGYDLPEHIYTVKYAADAIKKLIGGGGNV